MVAPAILFKPHIGSQATEPYLPLTKEWWMNNAVNNGFLLVPFPKIFFHTSIILRSDKEKLKKR